jgi:hypothetical protein
VATVANAAGQGCAAAPSKGQVCVLMARSKRAPGGDGGSC